MTLKTDIQIFVTCIVSYVILWYPIPLHSIARYCVVGFGVRAVSRKTPIYFIENHLIEAFMQNYSTESNILLRISDLVQKANLII